jgi:hypothetical protein
MSEQAKICKYFDAIYIQFNLRQISASSASRVVKNAKILKII